MSKVEIDLKVAEKAYGEILRWHAETVMSDAAYTRWLRRLDVLADVIREAGGHVVTYEEIDA